jgi:hypothetical protein
MAPTYTRHPRIRLFRPEMPEIPSSLTLKPEIDRAGAEKSG